LPIYDDLSESEVDENEEENIENTDNEDEDDIDDYTVENSYIEEKEEALIALKEIAENTE